MVEWVKLQSTSSSLKIATQQKVKEELGSFSSKTQIGTVAS